MMNNSFNFDATNSFDSFEVSDLLNDPMAVTLGLSALTLATVFGIDALIKNGEKQKVVQQAMPMYQQPYQQIPAPVQQPVPAAQPAQPQVQQPVQSVPGETYVINENTIYAIRNGNINVPAMRNSYRKFELDPELVNKIQTGQFVLTQFDIEALKPVLVITLNQQTQAMQPQVQQPAPQQVIAPAQPGATPVLQQPQQMQPQMPQQIMVDQNGIPIWVTPGPMPVQQ